MKKINWSLKNGSRELASGTELAEDEREVIRRVLARELAEEVTLVDDQVYSVKAGDAVASSYGDEFQRTGGCVGNGALMPGKAPAEELAPGSDGYLYPGPRVPSHAEVDAGMTCPASPTGYHDMNGEMKVRRDSSSELVYPMCHHCGTVAANPCRADRMPSMKRSREAIDRMIEDMKALGNLTPDAARAIANGCLRPEDHLLRSWFDATARVHHHGCARCKRGYVLSDEQQQQNLPYGFDLYGM